MMSETILFVTGRLYFAEAVKGSAFSMFMTVTSELRAGRFVIRVDIVAMGFSSCQCSSSYEKAL